MGKSLPLCYEYGASLSPSQGGNGEKVKKNAKALKNKESFFLGRCCARRCSVMVLWCCGVVLYVYAYRK
jgi:hypothetical protein